MEDNNFIKIALDLVYKFYINEVDKQGNLSILHPLAVGMNFLEDSEKLVVCGLLHDVIEDKWITIEQLSEIFPEDYVKTLLVLTRGKEVTYSDYISNIIDSKDLDAIKIKAADLRNNIFRNNGEFPELLARHKKALTRLEQSYKFL